MLDLRDLRVVYGSGRHAFAAVDRATLSIPAGGTLGLVGESGSGKSTIARALVGLTPVASGTISLEGEDVTAARARSARAYRKRVQMVFQDPFSSLNPRMTIGEMLGEAVAIRLDGGGRSARRTEAVRAIELVGLGAGTLDRYPHQFSGGQRQRIALARALAIQPKVVILDEVTSALDVSVQAAMLNLLKELQAELGLSYLFISHDLAVVGAMSDRVAVMYLGQLLEEAPAEQLFAAPQHPYTRALIDSVPAFHAERRAAQVRGQVPDPHNPPAGCRFHPRCAIGPRVFPDRQVCVLSDPQDDKEQRLHDAACHFAAVRGAPAPAAGRTDIPVGTRSNPT
jgi:peptide/nickel transport system ATP-binding protein